MALGLVFTAAACNKAKPKELTTTTEEGCNYTIKVYDFDNELLKEKTVSKSEYPTVLDALKGSFDAKYTVSQYGTSLVSLCKSLVDYNYYLSIYENNEYSPVGVDGLVIDDGDVFEFKNVCWNTYPSEYGKHLDEYDQLVDSVIYDYCKHKLATRIEAYEEPTFIPYDLLLVNLAKENGYDENFFNIDSLSSEYKTKVAEKDEASLSGQDFARWYYGARATGENLDTFKVAYEAYLESVTSYNPWDEYTLPFTLTFAKALNLDSKISSDVINTSYRAGTDFGCDGLSWQYIGLAEYKTIEESELRANLTLDNIQSDTLTHAQEGTSLAITLMAYAAANIDVRKEDFIDNKDAIEYLFDNYFDKETYQFEIEKTPGDISSSQIYASLVAYKIQRDKQKAVNIFA